MPYGSRDKLLFHKCFRAGTNEPAFGFLGYSENKEKKALCGE